jgi:hypothetical protein
MMLTRHHGQTSLAKKLTTYNESVPQQQVSYNLLPYNTNVNVMLN